MARGPWPRSGVRTRLPVVWKRPTAKLHPEAADWVARVQANGSSVSAATADAVSAFCGAIDAAGIRSRFFRLNLFCGGAGSGDTTRLNACLVPLYRGQSLGGTQFGGTTDTNVGPFVSGDYSETGSVSGGLTSSGSQYLNTGFATNLLAEGNRHLAAYEITRSAANFKYYLGSEYASGGGAGQFLLGYHGSATTRRFGYGAFGADLQSANASAGGFWVGVNHATSSGIIYRNGTLDVSGNTPAAVPEATNIFVFGANRSNVLAGGYAGRLGGYSIGLSMNGTQAAAYNAAMQAFQTALQRNV